MLVCLGMPGKYVLTVTCPYLDYGKLQGRHSLVNVWETLRTTALKHPTGDSPQIHTNTRSGDYMHMHTHKHKTVLLSNILKKIYYLE